MLHPVRVVPVAAIGRAPTGLHVGGIERLRPERPEKRVRIEGARARLDVVWLGQQATLRIPVLLQIQNKVLEIHRCIRTELWA